MGFATLYSVLLRRCNIPMFRYSSFQHTRNLGRIVDEKYGIDLTNVFDITHDLDVNFEDSTYNYFSLAPRDMHRQLIHDNNHELMTIASNLTLSQEEYNEILPYTNYPYEEFFHPFGYEPLGYTIRMLELMGHIPNDQEHINAYEEIYRLTRDGLLEGIDKDVLKRAVDTVLQKTGQSEEMRNHFSNVIDESFERREYIFGYEPAIGDSTIDIIPAENPDDNPTIERSSLYYDVTPLDRENINNYIENYNPENDIVYNNSNYIPPENSSQSIDEEDPVIEEINPEVVFEEENAIEDIEVNSQPAPVVEQAPNPTDQPTYVEEYNFVDDEENNEVAQEETIDEYIPGTNIRRPRYRRVDETDEEYERFLEDYYNRVFPQQETTQNNNNNQVNTETTPTNNNSTDNEPTYIEEYEFVEEISEDDMLDEYIPGTNIRRPRYRNLYETDEEYERFLENYYSRYFTEEQMGRGRR